VSKPTYGLRKGVTEAQRVDVVWRKSSYSFPEGACVEVAQTSCGRVLFRDSKVQDGPVMEVSTATAAAFTAAVERGTL
jgi:hypothetical protein